MAINQSCYGVRGAAGYGQLFTYYSIKEAVEELQQNAHGSVFDTITRETFTSLHVASPPPGIAESFERMVEPLLDTVLASVCESRDLATLRDTLLPKLLSGEISAPAAEELIAAST
jgi:type I restriction enzyme S subunit